MTASGILKRDVISSGRKFVFYEIIETELDGVKTLSQEGMTKRDCACACKHFFFPRTLYFFILNSVSSLSGPGGSRYEEVCLTVHKEFMRMP